MTYVVPQALEFLRHGAGAPLWRLLTSPGNAVAVNAARPESAPYQTVAVETATGTTVTLTDTEPLEGAAFYRVEVSVP